MVLYFSSSQLQQLTAHAEQTYPEECCGLLLGRQQRQAHPFHQPRRWLVEVYSTDNTWDADVATTMADLMQVSPDLGKRHHYWIDPQELFAAQRYARQQQLDVIGIYHSHPDHPAMPSESDRRMAWADYAYVIVSVAQGSAQETRCWSLDARQQFQPEEMKDPDQILTEHEV